MSSSEHSGGSANGKDKLKELVEWTEEQRKKDERTEQWVEKQRPNLSKAVDIIAEIHDISTRRKDFLLLVFLMGVAVNLATSSFLDMMLESPSPIVFVIFLFGMVAIVASYYIFNSLNMAPVFPAQLDVYLSHDDLMFYASYGSSRIIDFMNNGEGIEDFQSFAQHFLTSLASLSDMMFGVIETRREIVADTDALNVDADYPPWHLTLYLPDFVFRQKTIRNEARFRVYPSLYIVSGQKAVRRLTVAFSLQILNPEHPYSDEFLKVFYELRLSQIPRAVGFALSAQLNSIITQLSLRGQAGKPT